MEYKATVHVLISFSSWFKKFTDGKEALELEVTAGTSALSAVVSVGIPEAEIGFITINGLKADKEQAIVSGDRVKVYPYIVGG